MLNYTTTDPTVRLVLLLTIFATTFGHNATTANEKLKALKLTPLTRDDLVNLLLNPFVERYLVISNYAQVFLSYSQNELKDLLRGVAIECLALSSKVLHFIHSPIFADSVDQGIMLEEILKRYPDLKSAIASAVEERYKLHLNELPIYDGGHSIMFRTPLCGDYYAMHFDPFLPLQMIGVGSTSRGASKDGGSSNNGDSEADVSMNEESDPSSLEPAISAPPDPVSPVSRLVSQTHFVL
jgi:hypothetical protein